MTTVEVACPESQGKRKYELARKPGEEFINDYNPAVLMAWNGNIDLQYVGDDKDVVSYITAYTTKGEIARKVDALKHDDPSITFVNAIYKMGVDELNSREVGGLEMCDDLLGMPNYSFDTAEVWIPTDPRDKRSRMLKSKQARVEESEAYHPNLVDTHYPNRCTRLENHSLYNIATNYEWPLRGGRMVPAGRSLNSRSSVNISDAEYNRSDEHSPFYAHPNVPSGDSFEIRTEKRHFAEEQKRKSVNAYEDLVKVLDAMKEMKRDEKNLKKMLDQLKHGLRGLDMEEVEEELQIAKRIVDN
ncbi:unnamed protein product [Caenorhabditis sp. 36 PRJEB53466]|nr:unnamed protein product [Caenorhabditis sp. 36 PRJEB53466]